MAPTKDDVREGRGGELSNEFNKKAADTPDQGKDGAGDKSAAQPSQRSQPSDHAPAPGMNGPRNRMPGAEDVNRQTWQERQRQTQERHAQDTRQREQDHQRRQAEQERAQNERMKDKFNREAKGRDGR